MNTKKNLIQNKNNYAPRLPEKQINKIVKELSNPNLLPIPYSPKQAQDLTNKVAGIVNTRLSRLLRKKRSLSSWYERGEKTF